jgi:hypothetical protein
MARGEAAVDHPITGDVPVTLVCGLVVAFYAAKRYNTPETNRLSTTRSLFYFTGAGYVATTLLLFILLCQVVLKPGILPLLGLEHIKEVAAEFATPPVLAAVILTTLLPHTAVLSVGDAWLLNRFQGCGHIPHGARSLAKRLEWTMLQVSEADIISLHSWIANDGDIPNELERCVSADPAGTSRGNLVRVLCLYQELKRVNELANYAAAFQSCQYAWQAIHEDFRVFTAQSRAFFVLFDHLAPVGGAVGQDALNQARDRYQDICRKLYERMAECLAQLLIIAEGSALRIEAQLQAIGFRSLESSPPLPIGPFVFMGVIMILTILGIVAVVRPPAGPFPLALTAVLIGSTKMIGVLAAVLPKVRWSAFRPDNRGNLPYLAWIMSALLAALVSLLVERVAFIIASHTVSAAFNFSQYPLSPLAPTTFGLSLAVAIVCDIDLRLGHGQVRRITEGMICGATMVTGIFICIQLLDIPSATAAQTGEWFPFVFSFSLGFISGYVAPYLYRRARGEEPETQTIAVRAG